MSRRPANDRAAQNAQTLKALVKLEGNKVCADCKRNKHPRWASWNLGVFVCIRCSGIHRGMGTHISRVKSVDLDAWTDEQLQSVLKWGNTRANKYWEAKLAPGHVPSEAKIENFIRTKYESKRWVMDGPMPDPSTLDAEGDDNMPLNIVQEKAKIERSASQRQASTQPPPQPRPAANVNLFDDFAPAPPVRPNTADIPNSKPTRTGPPAPAPAPKPAAKPQDSLLGLDFFGGSSASGIGRPSSAASNPAASTNPRGDLKSSILSLYSAPPKPQPAPQPQHDRQPSFGGIATSPAPPKQDAFGGLADAFSGLSFPNPTTTKPPPPQPSSAFSAFGSLTSPVAAPKATTSPPQVTSPPPLSGGSFFDALPSKAPPAKSTVTSPLASNGLEFSFTQRAPPPQPAAAPAPKPFTTSISADLFAADDFGGFASSTPASPPKPAPAPQISSPTISSSTFSSPFNLSSQPASAPKPAPQQFKAPAAPQTNTSMFDPWASGNDSSPWGAPDPAPAKPAQPKVELGRPPAHITPNDIQGGWGEPISSSNKPVRQASVTADEDFGGWTSASTTQTPVVPPAKSSGGFGGTSDPFDNPWG
ncbi:hypothetical protein AYL99_07380 [Fonsecaea erecta]|uniref:Arf-GAP domain-containing protein n=1 Tax=Fonsecaea erecta TaxID=1367422 RepID=A0A178ZES3_9EURO|nr:hypothetical protein AYL99_07380 [Fonsecaea erecta]OAP58290.1 hypothetical protein AYL99_07380 [Fonsecaea erecta]